MLFLRLCLQISSMTKKEEDGTTAMAKLTAEVEAMRQTIAELKNTAGDRKTDGSLPPSTTAKPGIILTHLNGSEMHVYGSPCELATICLKNPGKEGWQVVQSTWGPRLVCSQVPDCIKAILEAGFRPNFKLQQSLKDAQTQAFYTVVIDCWTQ